MTNNDWKNYPTKIVANHTREFMSDLMMTNWGNNKTEEDVRDIVEEEIRAKLQNMLDREYNLPEMLWELLEDAIDEVNIDELVEFTMGGIETDKLKRKFIYTFWDTATECDIDVEADGFEEASYIMFSDNEYDPNLCEMVQCVENK